MKSVFLKKLAEQQAKKTATKEITTEQFKKFRKQKKELSDKVKSLSGSTFSTRSDFAKNKGKFGVIERKFGEAIGDKNLSKANKALDEMKNFVKNIKDKIKDKPIQKTKKVRKGQFATMAEARQAAKDAGKKTFNFGGKVNIPVDRKKQNVRKDISDLTKGMTADEKKSFRGKRDNEIAKLKKQQLKEMMSDKYGGGTSLGGVRVQKLTPEGEKLLKENKLSTIVNAQKFIKFKTKGGKEKTMPSNKYIVEGIGSRDAPLVPKGAVPKTKEDKKAFREYFENEMDDSQRLEYILQRFEPQYTSSQLADILGITARDLTATIKAGSGKFKQFGVGDAELQALKDKFQVRAISKDMKTGGMVKYKSGTGKKTIGKKVRDYVKKSPIKTAMGGLGAYEIYDVGKYAMDTLGPIMGFKSGTKGKTIRGIGKAMRGYGKAMTGRKK